MFTPITVFVNIKNVVMFTPITVFVNIASSYF